MRVVWTDIASYPTIEEARSGKRRSIARRELLAEPKPSIVQMGGAFFLMGAAVMKPWGRSLRTGGWRDCLVGKPIAPPRPRRKAKIKKPRRWKR